MMTEKIKEILESQGADFKEKSRTIYTTCPKCNRRDKFSILKENGACICYHGNCEFGKGWLEDWLAAASGIPREEARKIIYREAPADTSKPLELTLGRVDLPQRLEDRLQPIAWPPPDTISIEPELESDGSIYLLKRSIPESIAQHYGLRFNLNTRRVVIPAFLDGKCVGWQGRSVDKVDDDMKIRNNEGFSRERLLLFYDLAKTVQHVVICEGPFDAMKFYLRGGAVATMGKVVTDKQLDLIRSLKPKKVYIALDDDAADEINALIQRLGDLELYKPEIPESCRKRCELYRKKPDFGECTFEEAAKAFDTAKRLSGHEIYLYLK